MYNALTAFPLCPCFSSAFSFLSNPEHPSRMFGRNVMSVDMGFCWPDPSGALLGFIWYGLYVVATELLLRMCLEGLFGLKEAVFSLFNTQVRSVKCLETDKVLWGIQNGTRHILNSIPSGFSYVLTSGAPWSVSLPTLPFPIHFGAINKDFLLGEWHQWINTVFHCLFWWITTTTVPIYETYFLLDLAAVRPGHRKLSEAGTAHVQEQRDLI